MGGAWYILANSHETQGQWHQAIQYLQKVVRIDQKYQLPKLAENIRRLQALTTRVSQKTGQAHE
jgi:tetratricopeptide (TPR) repeat protein